MNIVDSSAWLEFFADSKYARHFASAIEDSARLLVPTIILYEVFKHVLLKRGEMTALGIVAHVQLGTVVELDRALALLAAKLSKQFHLPMADSIILATAQFYHATLWTMDADFKNFPSVKYFPK